MKPHICLLLPVLTALLFFISCKKEEINGRYKVYEEYSGGDMSSLLTSGNEIIITGEGMHNSSLLILKTDLQGNLVWRKYYDMVEHNASARGVDIHETPDGNFLIGAIYYTTGKRYGILKVNNDGDTLWSYHFKKDAPNFMYDLTAVTPGGDIVAVGETSHKGTGTEYDMTFLKISQDGQFLFSRSYPDSCVWWIYDARPLENGNILFSNRCYYMKSFAVEVDDSLKIVNEYVFSAGDDNPRVFITSPGEVAWAHTENVPTSFTVTCSDLQSQIRWQHEFEFPTIYKRAETQRIYAVPGGYMMGVFMVNDIWYPSHTGDPAVLYLNEDGEERWRWSDTEYFTYCDIVGLHYTSNGWCTVVGSGLATNEDRGIFIWQVRME